MKTSNLVGGIIILFFALSVGVQAQPAYIFYEEGKNQLKEGKTDEAIESFSKAITKNDQYLKAYLSRAEAYKKKGNHQAALHDYNVIIEYEPDNHIAIL